MSDIKDIMVYHKQIQSQHGNNEKETCNQIEIMNQIKYYKQRNDWENIVRMFDLKQDISWFISNLTIEILSELTYAITQHISNIIGEYQKQTNKDINDILEYVIEEYQFLQNLVENIEYDKKIYNSFAYINKQFFNNLNSNINNLIKKYKETLEKDIDNSRRKLFNNLTNCEKAIKYYTILLHHHPDDIKILYRFAHLLSSINDYSLGANKKVSNLKLQEENAWIKNFVQRTLTAGKYYNDVIKLYEDLTSEQERKRYRNIYIKSEYNLVKSIHGLYKSYFNVDTVWRCAGDDIRITSTDIKCDLSEMHKDIRYMVYIMDNIFDQINLPNRRLSENEIQRIANIDNEPEKPFNIYYRQGVIDILVAECAYVIFPNRKSTTSDECMQFFIKRMKHAIDMFYNVAEIKNKRKLLGKRDTGGFLWEIFQLGFCYSVLGLSDSLYNEKLVNLIQKYNKRKGISLEKLTQSLYYYIALGYFYNKNTFDLNKAICYLKRVTNKKCPCYEKAQDLLQYINNKGSFERASYYA